MADKAQKRFNKALDGAIQARSKRRKFTARLGKADGTIYVAQADGTRKKGYAWARVDFGSGAVTEMVVRCRKVPRVPNLWVTVQFSDIDDELEVLEEEPTLGIAMAGDRSTNVAEHAWQHGRFGPDPIYLNGLLFQPFLVTPSDENDLNVYLRPFYYKYIGTPKFWPGGNVDLTGYVPTSGQDCVIVGINPVENTPVVLETGLGDDFLNPDLNNIPFSELDVAAVDHAHYWPSMGVRLYAQQTSVDVRDIWFDMRWMFQGGYYDTYGSVFSVRSQPTDPPSGQMVLYAAADGLHVLESDGTDTGPLGEAGSVGTDRVDTLFVGKHGDDGNDGKQPSQAFLTVGAAITAASALTPASDNRILIVVLDAGIYEEEIVVPEYVYIRASHAEITTSDGTCVTLGDNCLVDFNRIINTNPSGYAGVSSCIVKSGGSSLSWAYVRELTPGVGGYACVNSGTGSQLFLRAEKIVLPGSSYGVAAVGAGAGHIHVHIGDIYLNGDTIYGLWALSASGYQGTIVGHIEHILSTGGSSGRTAIRMEGSNTDARIDVSIDEIGANIDDAIDCQRGILTLQAGRVVGDITVATNGELYADIAHHVSGSLSNSGVLSGKIGNTVYSTLILNNDDGLPPLNMVGRSVEPTSPNTGDIYLDDGTNTSSSSPGFRQYNGATWDDLGALAGGASANFDDWFAWRRLF